jgi:hypothetical protein
MRIITEDNIQQLENLSFSKNIEKLTHIENVKMKDIMPDLKLKTIVRWKIRNMSESEDESSPDYEPRMGQITVESSESSEDSFAYAPRSLPRKDSSYMYELPEPTESPPFNPNTPESSQQGIPSPRTPPGSPPRTPPGSPPEFEPRTPPGSPPEFEPRTPPGSPPLENRLSGGGNREGSPFSIGDVVYYRGGNQGIKWRVKDNPNGKFITIETDTPELLDDPDDMIKVVRPMDIFHETVLQSPYSLPHTTPYNIYDQEPYNHGVQSSQLPQSHPQYGLQMPPEINVNPVIKIVNGPDNSIETGSEKIPASHFAPNMNGFQEGISHANPIQPKNAMPLNTIESTNTNANENGVVDFSNLVIKKI